MEEIIKSDEHKELEGIFFHLLLDAYGQAKYYTEYEYNSKLKESVFFNLSGEDYGEQMSQLYLSHYNNITKSDYLLNGAIKSYLFDGSNLLPKKEDDIELFIDFLATYITPFYLEISEKDIMDYDKKISEIEEAVKNSEEFIEMEFELKYEMWKDLLFEDFVETLKSYEFIENVNKKKFKNPDKDLEAKKTTTRESLRFSRTFTSDEQSKLFDGLINSGFLPKETVYSNFCYVFGGTAIPENEKPFEPLIWQKSVGLLAYCIENLFADTDNNIWKITANCFLWKDRPPCIDTMKNTVSKYKKDYSEKPKEYEKIDTIINNL